MQNEMILQLLKEHVQSEVASGYAVGAQLGLYAGEKELLVHSEGLADREIGIPVTRDTIFRLYSMTKPVTSVAAHILIERGLLSKDDPLEKYLPEYADMQVLTENGLAPAERKIYIRDLLNMTSGLVYPGEENPAEVEMQKLFDDIDGRLARGEDGYTTAQVVSMIAKMPLCHQPGKQWHYGLSADVLGHVMELVTGKSLGEIFQEEIFEPLEMHDTGFYVPEEKQHRFAQLYEKLPKDIAENEKPDALIIETWRHLGLSSCLQKPAFESGGAGLVSTLEDYSHFARMLANGGVWKGRRLISEETVNMFAGATLPADLQPSFDWEHLAGYSYSNLLRVGTDLPQRHVRSGEIGWDGWCGPYFLVDIRRKISCVYMVQVGQYQHRDFIFRLRELVGDVCEE